MSNSTRLYTFVGGATGAWQVTTTTAVKGEPLAPVGRLDVIEGARADFVGSSWALRGVTSHERYVTRPEKSELVARQASIGRPSATLAALIPIRKTAAWWGMTQDERREVFEARSRHLTIGLRYLPAVARRLHHCRDLGEDAPFDFLTWFDFAESDAAAFDQMLTELRTTPEWTYVDREFDVRMRRSD